MNTKKKHSPTSCLLSLAIVFLLLSCSRRTVQLTTVDVSSRREETLADTVSSMYSRSRTVTDTAGTTASSVTMERDTFLLQWDTIGSQTVLTSAVRIHMLSTLMAREVAMKTFDDIISQGVTVRRVSHAETDFLTKYEEGITEDEPPTQVCIPTRLGKVITGLLYFMPILIIAISIVFLLRIANYLKHRHNV